MRRFCLLGVAVAFTGCCPDSGVITLLNSPGGPAGTTGTAGSATGSGGTAGSATGASGSTAGGSNGAGTTGHAATGGTAATSATGSASGTGAATSGGTDSGASNGGTGTSASSGGTGQGGTAGTGGGPFLTVSVFAGQLGGQGYADGIAGNARFWAADDVVADGAGHLFVADTGGDTLREIDLATGAVTTLAGLAASGGSNDGVGSAARFQDPYALTYDGATTLYVADTYNNTVRAVVIATRQVTTLAGQAGPHGSADNPIGTSASFWYPQGIATDGAGNVFVADTQNGTIREIDASTTAVTTLAGSPGVFGSGNGTGQGASFTEPCGLAYDGAGHLFVADEAADVIREIDLSSGMVSTLAGTAGVPGNSDATGAAASFNGPIGLAWDGNGNLLVVDSGNDTLRSIVASSGAVTTLAGTVGVQGFADGVGLAATFHFPWGVGSDGAGDVYVADGYNDTVRQISQATRTVTTVAGLPPHDGPADGIAAKAQFYDPQDLAYDGTASLFVADAYNDTVRQVTVSSGAVTTLAGVAGQQGSADSPNATFNSPHGIATDGAGNVFVADTGNCTIRQVVVASGTVSTLAGTPGQQGSADGADAGFFLPWAVAWGSAGTLYVADTFNNTVRAIDVSTHLVRTLAGTPGTGGEADGTGANAGFSSPAALAYDGAGTLYVADSEGETIRQVAVASATVTTLAGQANQPGSLDGTGTGALFSGPGGLALDGAGHLFVSDVGNSTVREIDLASGAVTTVLGLPRVAAVVPGPAPSEINWPVGLAFVANGCPQLFLADSNENALLVAR